MTDALVAVIVVLLIVLMGGFVVAARRVPLGRSRRPPLRPGEGSAGQGPGGQGPAAAAAGDGERRPRAGGAGPQRRRYGPQPGRGGGPAAPPAARPSATRPPATRRGPVRPAPRRPEGPVPAPSEAAAPAAAAPAAAPPVEAPPIEVPPAAAPPVEAPPVEAPPVEVPPAAAPPVEAPPVEVEQLEELLDEPEEPAGEQGVVAAPRFRERLSRTRDALAGSITGLRGRQRLDDKTVDELEEALILADVGLPTTTKLLDELRERARSATEGDDLTSQLRSAVAQLFDGDDRSLHLEPGTTNVWLFVGVNGAGKTTTIGKLAAREVAAGHRVVLGAGDTFRAAAADQLELWAERSGASIVRGAEGADPSSVIFDAVQHAAARDADLVLADSAGRLHTKINLMEELRKVRRVADRPPGHVSEVLLVIDATTGQNGLVQARQFSQAVGVTGIVLTKLDGTAKGGIALAIRSEIGLPIKLIGLGEGADDLVEFDPDEFAEALFGYES